MHRRDYLVPGRDLLSRPDSWGEGITPRLGRYVRCLRNDQACARPLCVIVGGKGGWNAGIGRPASSEWSHNDAIFQLQRAQRDRLQYRAWYGFCHRGVLQGFISSLRRFPLVWS